jgi:hypothetical protein
MIKLKDILNESTNYNPKDFGTVNTTYEWLEDAYLKKKIGDPADYPKVKKELTALKKAMSIAWKYSPLIDGNVKPEEFFRLK